MARREFVLSVFVASPSNVQAERTTLGEVIDELNVVWSRTLGIRLELLGWETHAYPGFGVDAKDVINRQVPDDYDVFCVVMWSRFGSPTGRAESGTEEEFMRAKSRWDGDNSSVQLMLYFKEDDLALSDIDTDQLAKVRAFRKSLPGEGGLYWEFKGTGFFGSLVRVHLARVVQHWHAKHIAPRDGLPAESSENLPPRATASQPIEADQQAGLFDFAEEVVESFEDAGLILARFARATESLNKKIITQTKHNQELQASGKANPAATWRHDGQGRYGHD